MKRKSIKDAVHGYINLEEPFWRIIDTPEFQRLKWIEQTSYRVLYPSARHDRFIHSIGVYHLGQKAIQGFIKNCTEENTNLINQFKYSFLLACILHDIGHAPFSHTCEDLFNYQQKMYDLNSSINKEFIDEMKDHLEPSVFKMFELDYKFILSPEGRAPSEHEVMSSIIVCRKFEEYKSFFDEIPDMLIDLDLVVRSIIGCCYTMKRSDASEVNRKKGIKNCLIRLLNSSTVDVDKLDYIARDTQMSGYDNIVLDTERLLDSICIVCKENVYRPSYKKSALSVINNVVIAKNAQAKWIVNHPIVIYEAYILRRAIGEALKKINIFVDNVSYSYDEIIKFIFSSKSLSKEGNQYTGGRFNLLSDVEILNLMKQNIDNLSVSEYFSRNERKHPIWKSNEEFLFCLNSSVEKAKEVAAYMAPLITYLNGIEDMNRTKQIDDLLYKEIQEDDELEGKEYILQILDELKEYKKEDNSDVEFNYVILPAKNRFYSKIDSSNLYIKFGNEECDYTSYDIFENKNVEISTKEYEFFYLYSKSKISAKHFLAYLNDKAHASNEIRM